VKILVLILLHFTLLNSAGLFSDAAGKPIAAPSTGASSDTLKKLGLLVDKNKISNNALAIKYAKTALAIAEHDNTDSNLVDAYKWLGKAYHQSHKDSSFYYLNIALHIADSCNLYRKKVNIFYDLASLYTYANDYQTAISLLDSSIRLAEKAKSPEGIANACIAMGNIKFNVQDYENARTLYDSALKVARENTLYKQMGVAIGNLARKQFEKDSVVKVLQKEALLYLEKVTGVEEEMAYIFINIGLQCSKPDSAIYFYEVALKLALNANLPKIEFGAYNNMAYSYLDKKEIGKAEACLRDMAIPAAQKIKDNDWLASLYDTYADVCVEKGDYKSALGYQKKAMSARKIDTRQKSAEQVNTLAALYQLKNKQLIIQNKEKEILLQRNRLQQVQLWLAIALLLVIASVFTTMIMQQRSRARFQKEQIRSANRIIDMEETEKGRISRELHDITGQLVLGISGTIENINFPDPEIKELINARIKELGASIRQISHRMNRAMIEHFSFSEMIGGLCEDVQKLSHLKVDLEMEEEFPDLSNELVLHFYRITQELLTNAGKYARDSQVKIKVSANNGKIMLSYADNGPGFNMQESSKPSMGILNIFERAKLIGGQAQLKSAPGKGTQWEIVFPVF
jgi:two-component system, NarL family, sensor kinase